MKGRQFTAA